VWVKPRGCRELLRDVVVQNDPVDLHVVLANAVVEAYKQVGFNVPLVVRLEGTEVEQGRKILAESGVDIIAAKDLTDAATKVVKAAG